jgi:hypothetical protein
MKQLSHSIINSTKLLLGRWTKVSTMGCILALVFLGATSAQPKALGTARPLKMSGIVLWNSGAAMEVVGTATHLGKFDSSANWKLNADGSLYVYAEFTAANGDTLQAEFPAWGFDPATGVVADSGVAIIKGGTGRFVGASGSYVATFSGANQEIFTAEGTISY